MRISDWSSDVCSSDLPAVGEAGGDGPHAGAAGGQPDWGCAPFEGLEVEHGPLERPRQAREVDRAGAAPPVADDLEALLEAADGALPGDAVGEEGHGRAGAAAANGRARV